ncbi:MAG TPA: rRNA adenine N-6-methyltransferase family protein, partial [Caldisericia bacterium]|nr:rRNA adenine N-6-methyltransferase family protein [Caldisericia bacterium]
MSKADLLKQKFRFKKSLGQNIFIGNTQNLLNLTNFMDDDFIIEVGTGTGDITKEIAKRVEFVRSYEIDERLKEFINENIIFYKNIEVKYMDFLLEDKFPESFKFFSNLPYSQAAEILKKCSMINSLK